ncbi:MAG: hypothetical protein AAFU67_05665 [Bacteroidota bacterium]
MPQHELRTRQLRGLAHRLGLEFQAEDTYDLPAQLADFRLFRKGSRHRASNIMRKQDELISFDARIFDYRYVKWAGNHVKRYQQTVFFLQSTQLGLPELWLRPETIMHKIGELFGRRDIDFVRFPKFSGQYRLTGEDEIFIRHHFTDEVLNYFTIEKGWSLEGIGYYLILYKKNRLFSPRDIEYFYKKGIEVFRMLADK